MDDLLTRILDCMGPQHGAGKELAVYLGISPNVITNWKNGSNRSYRRYVKEIAKKYNVSVDYLLGKTDQKEKAPEKSETLLYAAYTGSQASPEAMARNVARVRALLTPMAQRVGERYDRADAGTQSAVRKLLDIND